jgi:hypothetical protein
VKICPLPPAREVALSVAWRGGNCKSKGDLDRRVRKHVLFVFYLFRNVHFCRFSKACRNSSFQRWARPSDCVLQRLARDEQNRTPFLLQASTSTSLRWSNQTRRTVVDPRRQIGIQPLRGLDGQRPSVAWGHEDIQGIGSAAIPSIDRACPRIFHNHFPRIFHNHFWDMRTIVFVRISGICVDFISLVILRCEGKLAPQLKPCIRSV